MKRTELAIVPFALAALALGVAAVKTAAGEIIDQRGRADRVSAAPAAKSSSVFRLAVDRRINGKNGARIETVHRRYGRYYAGYGGYGYRPYYASRPYYAYRPYYARPYYSRAYYPGYSYYTPYSYSYRPWASGYAGWGYYGGPSVSYYSAPAYCGSYYW